MKHQGNDTESPSDDPILPEVYTATVACICIIDGKCNGMLTPELNILLRGFEKAKYSGLHDIIHPLHESCIVARRPHHTQRYCYLQTYKPKIENSFSRMLPPHIKKKWHPPLTMTSHFLHTGVNTQDIRPPGQTATPSPPSSLFSLFAIPFTMKTPCI